tara:strand:+ start:278 stop:709 length:432 start_codon:yes stop_codon:yes gene_type:complete
MASLLEIVKKNSSSKKIGLSRKLEAALGSLSESVVINSETPISPIESKWETLSSPERLSRTYNFESYRLLRYFVDNILDNQEETHHHAKISINYRSVTVETYTHQVNGITELDTELARFCDILFDDIKFYHLSRGQHVDSANE